jgi:hypothetical protein
MYVKCKDTYEALPKKTYLAILAVKNLFPDVEYILKTDDDMKCEIPAFESMLEEIIGYDYGGEIIRVNQDHNSTYHYPNVSPEYQKPSMMFKTEYCPGRFYFLSRNTTRSLVSQKEFFDTQLYEDYAVGYLATRIENAKILNLNAQAIFHDDTTIELK